MALREEARYFRSMRPLHLRLIAPEPLRSGIADFIIQLRSAGHFVSHLDTDSVPAGISPTPDLVISPDTTGEEPLSLDAAEARHIAAVLRFTGGNKRQSALLLGVARSTLLSKIRRYRITT
jgi:DNA-binding NtrC family response regulator